MTPDEFDFERTEKGGRYSATMANGELARLTFVDAGEGVIIADHTFVPPPYRGMGIAEAMVERLVSDARASNLKIHATCWFVADELKRRAPDWDDVRA